MANLIQKEVRPLKCDLTPEEHHDYSMQLAECNKESAAIEVEKKSVVAQFKAKKEENEEKISKLATAVVDGFETRDIECEVHFHKPEQGKKTVIRKDTNEMVGIERMLQSEWNLFSQPDNELSDWQIGE